jgi:hypothetical protein
LMLGHSTDDPFMAMTLRSRIGHRELVIGHSPVVTR